MRKIALICLLVGSFFLLAKKGAFAADPPPIIETSEFYQERDGKKCNLFNGCVQAGEDVTVNLGGLAYNNGKPLPNGTEVGIRLIGTGGCNDWPDIIDMTDHDYYAYFPYDNDKSNFSIPGHEVRAGCTYQVKVHLSNDHDGEPGGENNSKIISTTTSVQAECTAQQCNEDLSLVSNYELCAQINPSTPQYQACADCFSGNGIWTAIGCIPSKPESVVEVVITIGLALGGGIVLVMILIGSFMLSVSQGDPNKTKEAKEIITAAVIGLLFVIFSVTILQFIGVSILHIPGFGE